MGSHGIVRRHVLGGSLLALALVATLTVLLGVRAQSADVSRCDRFAADSLTRAGEVTGSGDRVVVIGDSWSSGLGLARSADSWPSRLPGTVHVAGFSGSGFGATSSDCGRVSFADRAPDALRGGADLVVVEGGLNDVDQSDGQIRAGFERLVAELGRSAAGQRVVVVGPASAPARAAGVPHLDALLARLAARHHLAYVRTTGLELSYLRDRLHLTPAGHRDFGDFVATRIAQLS